MKYLKQSLILSLSIAFFSTGIAQHNGIEKSNIQTFTPSKLLRKGQIDIKVFTSLFTQTRESNKAGKRFSIPRETFLTNTNEFFIGVSTTSRINVGLLTQYRSNTQDGSGVLSVFKLDDTHSDNGRRSGLTRLAPAVRIQPFEKISNFSFTSSFVIPIFEDIPGGFLDRRSYAFDNRFFLDHTFGANKWQVFLEQDFIYNFGERSRKAEANDNSGERFANNSLDLISSVFLSYFPTSKSTVFINAQQAQLFGVSNSFTSDSTPFNQNFTQVGIGGKYQLTRIFNIEASFGHFLRGEDSGLGQSFNIGVRALIN